ncbi:MAG: hypothetical protein KJ634_10290 [Gammaproteobacteria bacterium]|nr:hypothetical protein [Gammaproteobacteria bacterium]MBU1416000.1 hypothetical protein [Gammaproteobacteria bacterium]
MKFKATCHNCKRTILGVFSARTANGKYVCPDCMPDSAVLTYFSGTLFGRLIAYFAANNSKRLQQNVLGALRAQSSENRNLEEETVGRRHAFDPVRVAMDALDASDDPKEKMKEIYTLHGEQAMRDFDAAYRYALARKAATFRRTKLLSRAADMLFFVVGPIVIVTNYLDHGDHFHHPDARFYVGVGVGLVALGILRKYWSKTKDDK